jgi:hypothetical protein
MKYRIVFTIILAFILPLGWATRRFDNFFPDFIAIYGGDTLWATVVYLLFRIIFIQESSFRIFYYALTFAFLIEISQFYHASWIDTIRHTTFGALVLGNTFLWSDLVCYVAGITIGFLLDKIYLKPV